MAVVNKENVDNQRPPMSSVINIPGLGVLTRADLPRRDCRWTPRRKAVVAAMLAHGFVHMDEMAAIYGLSLDELAQWQDLYKRFGLPGLRVTRCQIYGDHKVRSGARDI